MNKYASVFIAIMVTASVGMSPLGVSANTTTHTTAKKVQVKAKTTPKKLCTPKKATAIPHKKANTADRKPQKPTPAKPAVKKLPKLLDLGSTSCIPCKMMAPILDELTKEYKGKLEVSFIDVWKNKEPAEKYNINSIPTQIFFDAQGKEVFRHVGYWPKDEIIKAFRNKGIKFGK